ncbi:hypothetical protein VaNZ11_000025, partial [Volvox africanus]
EQQQSMQSSGFEIVSALMNVSRVEDLSVVTATDVVRRDQSVIALRPLHAIGNVKEDEMAFALAEAAKAELAYGGMELQQITNVQQQQQQQDIQLKQLEQQLNERDQQLQQQVDVKLQNVAQQQDGKLLEIMRQFTRQQDEKMRQFTQQQDEKMQDFTHGSRMRKCGSSWCSRTRRCKTSHGSCWMRRCGSSCSKLRLFGRTRWPGLTMSSPLMLTIPWSPCWWSRSRHSMP